MNQKNISFRLLLTIACLLCISSVSYAQLNPVEVHKVLLKNTSDSTLINSYGFINIVEYPEQDPDLEFHPVAGASNLYEIIYTPVDGFIGFDIAHVEYREQGSNNQFPVKYTSVVYEVVNSIINVGVDNVSTEINEAITIQNLDNDTSTADSLSIIEIVSASNGSATIIKTITPDSSGVKIRFTPVIDFVGMAYVNYVIEDELGTTATGIININVIESIANSSELISITTTNEHELLIPLSANDLSIDDMTSDVGSFTLDGAYLIYTADDDSVEGEDEISLSNNSGYSIDFIITVVDLVHDIGYVKDDIVYTQKNTTVDFNVLENDLMNNYPITNYSDDLIPGNNPGDFSYTTPDGFEGELTFDYSVWNGFEFELGEIRIRVSDFKPKAIVQYKFNAVKNQASLFEYNIPLISNYFQVYTNPNNGSVEYIDFDESLELGCETVSTERSFVYTPDLDFVGVDEFELEYCLEGQSDCQLIKIAIDVIDEEEDCHCVSNCVWEGDANNDGQVKVDDLLAIAYNLGETGEQREEVSYNNWIGESAEDWNNTIFNESLNTKFSDSDGDGMISLSDTMGIANNYSQHHNLLNDDAFSITDYPFVLTPQSTNLDSGDVLIIDIAIGIEAAQVIDLHGISFGISLPSSLVDSSTLKINFIKNSWFVANTPSVQMSKTTADGYVEAAFARTSHINGNGFGIIGQSVCIIEEDLDDVRLSSNQIKMKVKLIDAFGIDGQGNKIKLPNAETEVTINLDHSVVEDIDSKLLCYPNPSMNHLNVHFNGGNIMESINVFDLQGRKVISHAYLNTNHKVLDLTNLENGLYVVQVNSPNGIVNKKIEVLK